MLPADTRGLLADHLARVRHLHAADLAAGHGAAYLPNALDRKPPGAATAWAWQYVFPSVRLSTDPRTGAVRRHHVHEAAVSRAITAAVRRTGLAKRATSHSFRHSFANHLLEDGYDIRTVRELLGDADVGTMMLYPHVLNLGPGGGSQPRRCVS